MDQNKLKNIFLSLFWLKHFNFFLDKGSQKQSSVSKFPLYSQDVIT